MRKGGVIIFCIGAFGVSKLRVRRICGCGEGMGEYSPHHEGFRLGVRKGKKWAPDWETGEGGGLLGKSGQIHLF